MRAADCASCRHTHKLPDQSVTVPGFGIFWVTKNIILSGKNKCGVIALVATEIQCNHRDVTKNLRF